jgi:TfoX/Sxy family transcriptional regulator of competence genes
VCLKPTSAYWKVLEAPIDEDFVGGNFRYPTGMGAPPYPGYFTLDDSFVRVPDKYHPLSESSIRVKEIRSGKKQRRKRCEEHGKSFG